MSEPIIWYLPGAVRPAASERATRSADVRNGLLLAAVALALWVTRFGGSIDLRYDGAVYYLLGTSLAQGKGYRLLHEPGDPEAVQYPPVLPALVAVHELVLGTDDPGVVGRWLRMTFLVIFAAYLLCTYALARQFLTPGYALLVGVINGLYLHSFFLADLLFAEIPLGLASVVFVLCNQRSDRPANFVAATLAAWVVYLLRAVGLALLVAWVAEGVVRRRWKQAALRAAVAAAAVFAWQAYIHRVTAGEEYRHPAYAYQRADYQYYNVPYVENMRLIDPFQPELGLATPRDRAGRLVTNLTFLPKCLGEGVSGVDGYWKWVGVGVGEGLGVPAPGWVMHIPRLALGGLIALGLVSLVTSGEWFLPLYVAAYAGLVCFTPWPDQLTRYLAPLTPFLALGLVRALASVRGAAGWFGARTAIAGAVLAAVFGVEALGVLDAYFIEPRQVVPTGPGRFFYDETWADYETALAWLRERAAPDEVIVTSAAPYAYLRTGIKSVMPPMVADTTEAQRLLDSVPARYVIVDELTYVDVVRRYTVPVIRQEAGKWRRVYTAPGSRTHIYRRESEAADGSATSS
jgi:hypothetical protein